MRWLVLLLVGCNDVAPVTAVQPYGLQLRVSLSPSLPSLPEISVASLKLHFSGLTAVSDRSSDDARAQKDATEIAFGESADVELATAPPGLYSAISWSLGSTEIDGIDLMGAIGGQRLHVELVGGPFVARCAQPRSLVSGQRVRLALTADATNWFDGVDLSTVKNDEDDNGIIINMEDNAPYAFQILGNVINSFKLECEPW